MAEQKTVIDWGEFEAVPSMTTGPGAGGEGIKLPSQVGRGGFENVLGSNLRAGFGDLVQLLTLPSRFGATAFTYNPEMGQESARLQQQLVEQVGGQPIQPEGTVERIVADPSAPNAWVDGIMEGVEWVYDERLGFQAVQVAEEAKKQIERAVSSRQLQERKVQIFENYLKNLSKISF